MDKRILHEHKKMKRFFNEMKLEQAKRLAVLEYKEEMQRKRDERVRIALEFVKAFVAPVVTALVITWLAK